MRLYYTPGACSLAPHIALEVGAPFELSRVDLAANQQNSTEYLRINPKARVPGAHRRRLGADRGAGDLTLHCGATPSGRALALGPA